MPDAPTGQPKVDANAAIRLVNTKWINKGNCPTCGQDTLGVGDELFEVKVVKPPGLLIPERAMHLFAFVCSNCGNTIFVHKKVVEDAEGT